MMIALTLLAAVYGSSATPIPKFCAYGAYVEQCLMIEPVPTNKIPNKNNLRPRY